MVAGRWKIFKFPILFVGILIACFLVNIINYLVKDMDIPGNGLP